MKRIAEAREAQARCAELTAFQLDSPAIAGHLGTMIAGAEALARTSRAERRRAAGVLRTVLGDPRLSSASRLEQHRSSPLFDPVALDLEQIALALGQAAAAAAP